MFTSFQPRGDVPEDGSWNFDILPEIHNRIVYYVWQFEKCPETERIHVQGYLRIKPGSRMRTAQIKALLGDDTAHLKKADGTDLDNQRYCTKESSRIRAGKEYGTPEAIVVQQGERSDLESVVIALKEGATMGDLIRTFPMIVARYPRFLDTVKNTLMQEALSSVVDPTSLPIRTVEVIAYVGPSGTGKTRAAYNEILRRYGTIKNKVYRWPSERYHCKYSDQPVILLDDLDQSWFTGVRARLTRAELLNILDQYPIDLPRKNTESVESSWNLVLITSNIEDPVAWIPYDPAPGAVARRITTKIVMRTQYL